MMHKLAEELVPGEVVWLRFDNGRTGARITRVDRVPFHEFMNCRQSSLAKDVILLEVTLGRELRHPTFPIATKRWTHIAAPGDRLELWEKPNG